MFENNPINPKEGGLGPQNNIPNNLPTEPDDMFAGVEKPSANRAPEPPNALKSGFLKPKDGPTVLPNPDYTSPGFSATAPKSAKAPMDLGILKKALMALLGVLFGYGGWFAYGKFVASRDAEDAKLPPFESPSEVNNEQKNESASTAPTTTEVAQNVIQSATLDTDMDGLTDEEEKKLGTDPNKPDTDGDLVPDMDEARVWMTNPLKADSDGDGYIDSAEIIKGYNPNGEGKFAPPIPVVRFVSSTSIAPGFIFEPHQIEGGAVPPAQLPN